MPRKSGPAIEAPEAPQGLSLAAQRVLALFRARGCQLAGRGLLWQVLATAGFEQHFRHHEGLRELVAQGLLELQRGHRYVLTAAGEAYFRSAPP